MASATTLKDDGAPAAKRQCTAAVGVAILGSNTNVTSSCVCAFNPSEDAAFFVLPDGMRAVLYPNTGSRFSKIPEIHCRCFYPQDVGVINPECSDFIVDDLTARVIDVLGDDIRAFATRMHFDPTRPVRLLAAHVPPPAMVAAKLQLLHTLKERLGTCPAMSLAEFCKNHHCPPPTALFHGTSADDFVTLPSGSFTTTNAEFAKRYAKNGRLLEFDTDGVRVLDLQPLNIDTNDTLFQLLGGRAAAQMVRALKDNGLLPELSRFLAQDDDARSPTVWHLGLFMQGETELVCLHSSSAAWVTTLTGGVRRQVTADEIKRERDARMAIARAKRHL